MVPYLPEEAAITLEGIRGEIGSLVNKLSSYLGKKELGVIWKSAWSDSVKPAMSPFN